MSTSSSELVLPVVGMDCAECALTLERSVAQLDGVEHVQVSFMAGTLQAKGSLDRGLSGRGAHLHPAAVLVVAVDGPVLVVILPILAGIVSVLRDGLGPGGLGLRPRRDQEERGDKGQG